MIEMLDYSHEDILDIRKTFLYTCGTSDVFDVDFHGLFGIEPCTYAWPFVIFCILYFLISTIMNYVFELTLDSVFFLQVSGWILVSMTTGSLAASSRCSST